MPVSFGGDVLQASANGPLKVHGAGCPPHLQLQYAGPYFQLRRAPARSHVSCQNVVAPTVLEHSHAVGTTQKVALVIPHGLIQTPSHGSVYFTVSPACPFQATGTQATQQRLELASRRCWERSCGVAVPQGLRRQAVKACAGVPVQVAHLDAAACQLHVHERVGVAKIPGSWNTGTKAVPAAS